MIDILPDRPRTVQQALAIAQQADPDHILIAWTGDDTDDQSKASLHVMTACRDPEEKLTVAEVVYLCEIVKQVNLDNEESFTRVGPAGRSG